MAKTFDDLAARLMTKRQRRQATTLARQDLADMLLSEIRKRQGMSQKQLADVLKIKQPSLSKLESQQDMQVSTLQRIIEALGGRLIIRAQFPEGRTTLSQFHPKPKPLAVNRKTEPRSTKKSKVREIALVG